MTDVVDEIGRVRWHCPRCEARAAGRCWQCGKRREKTNKAAAYCNRCKRARDRQSQRVSREQPEQRERVRRYDAAKRKRPGYRERNTAHKREWMARHPDKFAEYAAKARAKYHAKRADTAWWEREKAIRRERYAKRQAQKKAQADASSS